MPGKKKKRHQGRDTEYIADPVSPGAGGRRQIVVPAINEPDAYRFTSKIRHGKISGEVFCKDLDRRRELGLPIIIPDE